VWDWEGGRVTANDGGDVVRRRAWKITTIGSCVDKLLYGVYESETGWTRIKEELVND